MSEIYHGQLSPVLCDTMVAVYELGREKATTDAIAERLGLTRFAAAQRLRVLRHAGWLTLQRPLRRTPGRRGIRVAVPSYPPAVTIRDPELGDGRYRLVQLQPPREDE